jgi:hypothetical protein
MIERTTVRLPSELLDKARHQAAKEGRTLTSLMEDGLRFVLEQRTKERTRSRQIDLPVSKAKGGFKPGFEELTYSEIQELDDLEYIERMKNFK